MTQSIRASSAITTRVSSYAQFARALDVARAGSDRNVHAPAAAEYGRTFWRRYDDLANRRLATEPGVIVRSLADALQPLARLAGADLDPSGFLDVDPSRRSAASAVGGGPPSAQTTRAFLDSRPNESSVDDRGLTPAHITMRTARELIESKTQALPPAVTGQRDYERSLELFREAYTESPSEPLAFHSVAMALADHNRWPELEQFAQEHRGRLPLDPWGWMAAGLAAHRQNKPALAAAMFDSALSRLDKGERARLDRIERVFRHSERNRYFGQPGEERRQLEDLYWRLADPLWTRDGNEIRMEFLARVAFAEFRWTVPELNLRGADSDRGDAHIRYGPPEVIAVFGPGPDREGNAITTVWIYDWGLMLVFAGTPTYGTARIPLSDKPWVEALADAQPVRWPARGLPSVDSLGTRLARFRGRGETIDLLLALAVPPAATSGQPSRTDFWLLDRVSQTLYRDSAHVQRGAVWTWTGTVLRGDYVYRVETSPDSGSPAGRTMVSFSAGYDPVNSISASGFAVSDVLLVSRPSPRASTATRWKDLAFSPLVGALPRGSSLGIVWETYELGTRGATADYSLALTIQAERKTSARISARILGALAELAGVEQAPDRLVLRFERKMKHAAALVDYFEVDLAETEPGSYSVTLRITDHATGLTAVRSTRFGIQ